MSLNNNIIPSTLFITSGIFWILSKTLCIFNIPPKNIKNSISNQTSGLLILSKTDRDEEREQNFLINENLMYQAIKGKILI